MEKLIGKLEFKKPANHTVKTHRSPFLTVALRHSERANSVPLHSHEYDEFVYSPNGLSQLIWTSSGSTVTKKLSPTTILWTPAGVVHSATWDTTWYSVGVLIRSDFLDSALLEAGQWRPDRTVFFHASRELTTLFQAALSQVWLERLSSNPDFARSMAVLFSNEFASCYQHKSSSIKSFDENFPTPQVIEFIDSNLRRNLTLADLARIANLSVHHFSRLFKKNTGFTPYQYVVSRRLCCALPMLSSKDLPIEEIARLCGFSSASSLAKAFKRVYKVSPTEYRKQLPGD